MSIGHNKTYPTFKPHGICTTRMPEFYDRRLLI